MPEPTKTAVTVQDLIDLCQLRNLDPSTVKIAADQGTQLLRSFKKLDSSLVEHIKTKELSEIIVLA